MAKKIYLNPINFSVHRVINYINYKFITTTIIYHLDFVYFIVLLLQDVNSKLNLFIV